MFEWNLETIIMVGSIAGICTVLGLAIYNAWQKRDVTVITEGIDTVAHNQQFMQTMERIYDKQNEAIKQGYGNVNKALEVLRDVVAMKLGESSVVVGLLDEIDETMDEIGDGVPAADKHIVDEALG